jgi:DNA-binding MarR family transcriptional regulator
MGTDKDSKIESVLLPEINSEFRKDMYSRIKRIQKKSHILKDYTKHINIVTSRMILLNKLLDTGQVLSEDQYYEVQELYYWTTYIEKVIKKTELTLIQNYLNEFIINNDVDKAMSKGDWNYWDDARDYVSQKFPNNEKLIEKVVNENMLVFEEEQRQISRNLDLVYNTMAYKYSDNTPRELAKKINLSERLVTKILQKLVIDCKAKPDEHNGTKYPWYLKVPQEDEIKDTEILAYSKMKNNYNSVSDVAKATGKDEDIVKIALSRLAAKGKIKKDSRYDWYEKIVND